ncbi:MAG: glutaredoxin family protein [Acidobacteria bacterium]|nr:glutaredoxin family protein [Acidobacteriota bacterium]
MGFVRVDGKDKKHKVVLYALSTCGWCRRTKELLVEEGVDHEYVDIDLCNGDEKEKLSTKARELNPRGNYPVLQVDDRVIVGYDPDKIREALA